MNIKSNTLVVPTKVTLDDDARDASLVPLDARFTGTILS